MKASKSLSIKIIRRWSVAIQVYLVSIVALSCVGFNVDCLGAHFSLLPTSQYSDWCLKPQLVWIIDHRLQIQLMPPKWCSAIVHVYNLSSLSLLSMCLCTYSKHILYLAGLENLLDVSPYQVLSLIVECSIMSVPSGHGSFSPKF